MSKVTRRAQPAAAVAWAPVNKAGRRIMRDDDRIYLYRTKRAATYNWSGYRIIKVRVRIEESRT